MSDGARQQAHPRVDSGSLYGVAVRPGSFTAEFDDATHVLTVAGELDEAASAALRDAIDARSGGYTRPLVIELSAVDYLPSAAVGVLARAHKQATTAGHDLDLVASEGTIAQRVLLVCGLPHRTS